jgi:pyroglutamyl-peptidase
MHLAATERGGLRGGFVHVPYAHEQVLGRSDAQPSLSLDTITRALEIAVRTAVEVHEDTHVPAGLAPVP